MWMSINKDTTAGVAESLLASISEIIESVARVELEQEVFIEIGCYFYRVSPAIMELQAAEYTPENAMDILKSLCSHIDAAKDLINKFECSRSSYSDSGLKSTIPQLAGVIKHMGVCLSSIPSSTFQDQRYAELAVRSISKEMQTASFIQNQVLQTEEMRKERSISEEEAAAAAVTESDLYSVDFEVSTDSSQVLNLPRLIEFLKSTSISSNRKRNNSSMSSTSLPQLTEYIEPLYDSFYCPLTKQIMDEPVTIESGVTYERKAIEEWFKEFDKSQDAFCPTTGQKLSSRVLRTNVALQTTIEEWKDRNEAAQIKFCRSALSLASSPSMITEAIRDLQGICRRKEYNKIQIYNAGILPLLVKFLEHKDRNVRHEALELLRQLAEDDGESKEIIARTVDMSTLFKLTSSSHQIIRHAALILLLELSRSQSVCQKIGSVTGAILMLIRMKYNQSVDAFSSGKAGEILRNLERSPENIKLMAENGLLEPLLNHLTAGSEEIQMEMASYLGEISMGHDSKTCVAERASPVLVKMVQSGNTLTREAAFEALEKISSHHQNSKVLVEAGIIRVMVEDLFTRRIYDEPMNSKCKASGILANIFEAGLELENLQVNTHGHTLSSDYVLYNMVYMLKSSTPDELSLNLIRIILCLAKSPKPMGTIVSVVKETEATFTLIELINSHHEELGVAAIKLLIALSPFMGHMLVERLCKTRGQPESLILGRTETIRITEKQAVSAKFLTNLPHQNLTLNLALLSKNTVPAILQIVNQIQRIGPRTSRYAIPYLEGLVGILIRFTTTLYEPQVLLLARNYNFTTVFTELLMKSSSDEVQKLSAIGLENLSLESVNLSEPPEIKRTKFLKLFHSPMFLSFGLSKKRKIPVCPIHRGICSAQNTFCLVDANAVERLLACLDHENVEVVEAALSALCTLLDDKVDVNKSVSMLSEVNAARHILNVVKAHKEEDLWLKSFWILERFLMRGGDQSASDISEDRFLPAILVNAFHHGHGNTRQMAEKILRHLNKMPKFHGSSSIF